MPIIGFINKHSTSFRILILVLLVSGLIGLTCHFHFTDHSFTAAEAAKFFISGLVVIGLTYSILTFEFIVKKNRDERVSKLSSATFDILKSWYGSPLIEYLKFIYGFEKTEIFKLLNSDIGKFMAFFEGEGSDSIEFRKSFNGILNYFEIICSGIKENVVDESFTKRYFEDVFYVYYDEWISLIKERRKKLPDMFCEFTTLTEEWRKSK